MNPRHFSSHSRRSRRVAGLFGQLEGRIENQFALLDPSARQPLDLHEELGAQSQQRFLGDHLLVLADQRGVHAVSPFQLVEVVLAELGRHGVAELLPQRFVSRSERRGVERGEVVGGEIGLRKRRRRP